MVMLVSKGEAANFEAVNAAHGRLPGFLHTKIQAVVSFREDVPPLSPRGLRSSGFAGASKFDTEGVGVAT
jgi:hypothetical protein